MGELGIVEETGGEVAVDGCSDGEDDTHRSEIPVPGLISFFIILCFCRESVENLANKES